MQRLTDWLRVRGLLYQLTHRTASRTHRTDRTDRTANRTHRLSNRTTDQARPSGDTASHDAPGARTQGAVARLLLARIDQLETEWDRERA